MKGKIASGVTTLVIVAIIACGVFNIQPVGGWVRYAFYYVVGTAKTAAAPTAIRGSGTGTAGDAANCRANLSRIEGAKAAIRAKGNTRATGGLSWGELSSELGGGRLSCPAGGEYSLGSMTQAARCSIGGNGTTSDTDDHLVKSY